MLKRNLVLGSALGIALFSGGLVHAQMSANGGGMKAPADNISGKKHPNLAAAQRLCTQAFEKITTAQQANEWDLDGHAAKAKELLDQAGRELKQAAMTANKDHKQ
jgi:hypothetical protein